MASEPPSANESTDSIPDTSPEETIYRRCARVSSSGKKRPPAISHFMPRAWVSEDRPGDTDGLSVTRSKFTTPQAASICPIHGTQYHVVELKVRFVQGLDLSVEKKPLPHDRGHAVIPELNSLDRRDTDKEIWMKEKAKQLHAHARMVLIVDNL